MKTIKPFICIALLFATALLSNCSLEKTNAIYRDVTYTTEPGASEGFGKEIKSAGKNNTDRPIIVNKTKSSFPLYASAAKKNRSTIPFKPNTSLPLSVDSCGDIIIMRDHTEIKAKVLEINPKTIKYKACNNLDGPLIVVNKENVFMIRYVNGSTETFKKEETQEASLDTKKNIPVEDRIYNNYAIASFLAACFFWLVIPAVIALICGLIALQQMNQDPLKYKGRGLALLGTAVGATILSLIALMLLSGAMTIR